MLVELSRLGGLLQHLAHRLTWNREHDAFFVHVVLRLSRIQGASRRPTVAESQRAESVARKLEMIDGIGMVVGCQGHVHSQSAQELPRPRLIDGLLLQLQKIHSRRDTIADQQQLGRLARKLPPCEGGQRQRYRECTESKVVHRAADSIKTRDAGRMLRTAGRQAVQLSPRAVTQGDGTELQTTRIGTSEREPAPIPISLRAGTTPPARTESRGHPPRA